jgi:hypothetical protein
MIRETGNSNDVLAQGYFTMNSAIAISPSVQVLLTKAGAALGRYQALKDSGSPRDTAQARREAARAAGAAVLDDHRLLRKEHAHRL